MYTMCIHFRMDRKTAALDSLKMRILTMDVRPGADLEEAALSEHYGISRTPMREVLQRLAGDGFVEVTPNRGAKVASMDLPVMRCFFQTAPLVYATIGRLAAENRTVRQIAALKAAQAAFLDAIDCRDVKAVSLMNHRFHEVIGEMAANPYLMSSLQRMLIDHTRLSQTFYCPASDAEAVLVKKAAGQHDEMISAIEAQEPKAVVDLTLQHWDLSRDRMERFVSPDPLPLEVSELKEQSVAV